MKGTRPVLGINCSGFHVSVCLVIDGSVRYAIAQERLSRVKRDKAFPLEAIRYCCGAAGIGLSEISDIFLGWNPTVYVGSSYHILHDAMRNRGKISYLALNELASLKEGPITEVQQQIRTVDSDWRIRFVDHHNAHLASGFVNSGFEEAGLSRRRPTRSTASTSPGARR